MSYEVFKSPDYGPAPESTDFVEQWLEGSSREFGHFVGGAWTTPQGKVRVTSCPADGRPLATVYDGTREEVDNAVKAAAAALPDWQEMGGHQRARHLYRIARQIQKRSRHFAVLESLDNGKPIRESRDLDIPLVTRHFYHHAGWAQLLENEFPDHEALGVVGQIIPWNFPLLMLAWKVAPALAAGNTVVLKPAEHTPLTALYFAEVIAEAGLPPGVVNIVTGAGATGEALVTHPDVSKIAFTGSTDVGRKIREQTAGSGKKLSLELGGKSPMVVFESADLDAAVEGVVDGIWFNQGQVCCAGSRLLVQEGVERVFMDRLKDRMETLRMGHPLDKSVDMGAIITERQLERIESYVEIGVQDGGQVWQPSWWKTDQPSENGATREGQPKNGPPSASPSEGFFYPPTLCTGVGQGSRIATDEVFGPVIVSMTFRTPDEAVSLANDTRYGLAASVWTEDLNLALDVAPKIKAGTVWVNCTNLFDGASGFGGYRESGFGREGGREGMWEYLTPKAQPKATSWTAAKTSGVLGQDLDATERSDIDRTRKLYLGGKQRRPDGGHSLVVGDRGGLPYAEVPRGNRKDIRNAVEAARKAQGPWARTSGHLRAQILYFVGENLAARGPEFQANLIQATGLSANAAAGELEAAINVAFTFAAWADKYDGRVHETAFRNVTLAMNEAAGVLGVRCSDRAPLAGVLGPTMAAVATGNTAVVVPSARYPVPGLDLVQVLETSDVPAGVINLVTGSAEEIIPTLAAHDDVDQYWDFVGDDWTTEAEKLSAGNLKRVWRAGPAAPDWLKLSALAEATLLRHATRVKNIWVPYGA